MALVATVLLAALLAGGCSSTRSTGGGADADSTAASDTRSASRTPTRPGPSLAPTAEGVRTIQLYSGNSERSLPVLSMKGGGELTLEFDLMEARGRPLSVYFFHADRTWRRDLSPSRYLQSFQSDTAVEYQPSRGTRIPYVHYTYRFPNDDIQFRLSGNYIIRVTEQGRRDEVLFERAFFVSESAGALSLGAEDVVIPGQRRPSIRPEARYSPPQALRGDPFGYQACFVRNGRFETLRCAERPNLARQPELAFRIDRDDAFTPASAEYFLDLSTLRPGGQIERSDLTASPVEVLLEPDFARFAGSPLEPTLNGQIVVRDAVGGRANPEVTAEYVRATFAFVPPGERPVGGEVGIAGSFTGMRYDADLRMDWVEGRGRYEGEVLLKQGQYDYFYESTAPELRRILQRNLPSTRDVYTTFVYYRDPREGTDRLLSVDGFRR